MCSILCSFHALPFNFINGYLGRFNFVVVMAKSHYCICAFSFPFQKHKVIVLNSNDPIYDVVVFQEDRIPNLLENNNHKRLLIFSDDLVPVQNFT